MIVLPKTFLNNVCETTTQRDIETNKEDWNLMLFYGKFKGGERLEKNACNIHLMQKSPFFLFSVFTQLGKYCVCFSNRVLQNSWLQLSSNPTACNQNRNHQACVPGLWLSRGITDSLQLCTPRLENNIQFRRKPGWVHSFVEWDLQTLPRSPPACGTPANPRHSSQCFCSTHPCCWKNCSLIYLQQTWQGLLKQDDPS